MLARIAVKFKLFSQITHVLRERCIKPGCPGPDCQRRQGSDRTIEVRSTINQPPNEEKNERKMKEQFSTSLIRNTGKVLLEYVAMLG